MALNTLNFEANALVELTQECLSSNDHDIVPSHMMGTHVVVYHQQEINSSPIVIERKAKQNTYAYFGSITQHVKFQALPNLRFEHWYQDIVFMDQ